jgi:hypothetical protein
VAIALGAVMFLALYSSFTFCFATVRTSRESIRAAQITLSRLEHIRVCDFNQITNTGLNLNPATFTEVFDPQKQLEGNGGIVYTGTFSAVIPPSGSVPDSYRTNMLLITVGVTWSSGKVQHSLTNQTYATFNGLESYIARSK